METREGLRRLVENSQTAHDVITASQVGRLAVALDVEYPAPNKGDPIPPGGHGVFFSPLAPLATLGNLREDGQPAGGGVAPPVPLLRRQLGGVRGAYRDALRIGDEVEIRRRFGPPITRMRPRSPRKACSLPDRPGPWRGVLRHHAV